MSGARPQRESARLKPVGAPAALALLLVCSACTFDPPGAADYEDAGFVGLDADRLPLDAGVADAAPPVDAGHLDAGLADVPPADAEVADAAPTDAEVADASPPDAGPADTGPRDAEPPPDTGPIDTGVPVDAGSPDTGLPPDAGQIDAGTPDTGVPADAGFPDTGLATDAATVDASGTPDSGFPFSVSNVTVPARGATPVIIISSDCVLDTAVPELRGSGCPSPVDLTHAPQSNGETVALWSVDRLTVSLGSQLQVVGDRPLVIVAHDRVTVEGFIDASGNLAASGPGGHLSTCLMSSGGGGANRTGGGGGGHAQAGAPGGARSGTGSAPGAGGLVRGNSLLVPLLGGCPGGPGWGLPSSEGGGGGGAVQISAAQSIQISGGIFAVGGGGAAANITSGGAGGGAGGAILLEADQIELQSFALLMAGGGGGGGGDGLGFPEDGAPGSFGSTAAAQGGEGAGDGGDGGDGGARSQNPSAGQGAPNLASAGGGGGGVGRVRINARVCTLATAVAPIANAELSGNASCFPSP